jgi:autotransporter translocation and assembly factor TamB
MVAAMESMEERLMDTLKALALKVDGVEDIAKRLTQIDLKLAQQGEWLDRVQTKVDLSMTSLGQVQQEQSQVARALKAAAAPPTPPLPPPPPPPRPPPLLPSPE